MRRLALLSLLLLGACATGQNMTLAPAVAPVVAADDYPLDLAAGTGGLRAGEAARLDGWLEAMQAGPGDRLGVSSGLAAGDVALVARRFAIPVGPGAAGPDGTIRVTLRRAAVVVPGCPDWSDEQTPTSSGALSRNFGCATLGNLAAMIADPRDLAHGRAGDGTDPRVSVRAIQMWRDSKPSGAGGLKAESTGGK